MTGRLRLAIWSLAADTLRWLCTKTRQNSRDFVQMNELHKKSREDDGQEQPNFLKAECSFSTDRKSVGVLKLNEEDCLSPLICRLVIHYQQK